MTELSLASSASITIMSLAQPLAEQQHAQCMDMPGPKPVPVTFGDYSGSRLYRMDRYIYFLAGSGLYLNVVIQGADGDQLSEIEQCLSTIRLA